MRPAYPPDPVGVAIRAGGQSEYHAWGHYAGGNNTTLDRVRPVLEKIWASDEPLLFFNAKFDLAVAHERLGLPIPDWRRVHDPMFLAFLAAPHSRHLDLKSLANDLLMWPPDERDAVGDWIWEHRDRIQETFGEKVSRGKSIGKWIWFAPGDVVAPYAVGDVDRTAALFDHLMPQIVERNMTGAYDRERQLLPMLMDNERTGIRVDVPGLSSAIDQYDEAMQYVERALRGRLSVGPDFNFDADQQVAEALDRAGVVTEWTLTPSGKKSVSKVNLLPEHYSDPRVASAFGYRNRLKTALDMFMRPWHAQAIQTGGTIHTTWNQVRGGDGGTRTGRPSTSGHNFLNLSKNFEKKRDGYVHPEFLNVPALPLVRRFCLPDEGHKWLDVDFAGQELRVFAHFERGDLWRQYQADPDVDPHAHVAKLLGQVAPEYATDDPAALSDLRTKIKILNFQSLYGGGAPAAARELGVSLTEAKRFKHMHDQALPGRRILNDEIVRMVRRGEPIRTWGGREYFPESPVGGRSFEYKLINYEVQGSAADITKQAMLDWYNAGVYSRFLVQVYDEIAISAPIDIAREEMMLLIKIMEAPRLTIPMRTDPEWGDSWGSLERFDV